MNSLQLQGRIQCSGFETDYRRILIRLAVANDPPTHPADTALVRSPRDCDAAAAAGYMSALFVNSKPEPRRTITNIAWLEGQFDWLSPGDVIAIDTSAGRYRVLWRATAKHNAFLVTDRCDHYCLMCSQPPKKVDDSWILEEISRCLSLLPRNTASVGFTGGEPFLDWRRFIPVVLDAQNLLPQASVHVLSNGRAFAKAEVVDSWSRVDQGRACLGIPIYSAVDSVHDHIVQSRGALDESTLGILRLKDRGNRVEIRLVLQRLTVKRLVQTCEWLARNLPFVDHVALMGMEDTGFALANHDELWIDPVDYGALLARGVVVLAQAGLKVSIYNLPLCVLPIEVRSYAAQSISDWKNAHPASCAPCIDKNACAGFFTTGRTKFSRAIRPILAS